MNATEKEALRQQMLLRALLGDARPGVVQGWLQLRRVQRGLAAYQAHAGALAERALAAAFPVLQQLLGEDSFAKMARHFWREQPPTDGDLACWGAGLPVFLAAVPTLADEPYLPDMARLEWAWHRVQSAADAPVNAPVEAPDDVAHPGPAGLALLGTHEPEHLQLALPPGSAVLFSAWPVFSLWQAHRSTAEDRFDAVRLALAQGRGEQGLVTRQGWVPQVQALPAAEARFTAALLAGRSLAQALDEAAPIAGESPFDFGAWLLAALQQQRLLAVHLREPR
jgi:hypothetical protein